MDRITESYPLHWPDDYARSPPARHETGRFTTFLGRCPQRHPAPTALNGYSRAEGSRGRRGVSGTALPINNTKETQ